MICKYSATFEFDLRPPLTLRGQVVASSAATCVARATREAQKALRPVGWTSLVVVLTERGSSAKEMDEVEEPDGDV